MSEEGANKENKFTIDSVKDFPINRFIAIVDGVVNQQLEVWKKQIESVEAKLSEGFIDEDEEVRAQNRVDMLEKQCDLFAKSMRYFKPKKPARSRIKNRGITKRNEIADELNQMQHLIDEGELVKVTLSAYSKIISEVEEVLLRGEEKERRTPKKLTEKAIPVVRNLAELMIQSKREGVDEKTVVTWSKKILDVMQRHVQKENNKSYTGLYDAMRRLDKEAKAEVLTFNSNNPNETARVILQLFHCVAEHTGFKYPAGNKLSQIERMKRTDTLWTNLDLVKDDKFFNR